jgi:hypothetical protein
MAELRGFELWTLSSRPGYSHGAVQAVAGFQLPLHGLFDLRMAITQIIRPQAHMKSMERRPSTSRSVAPSPLAKNWG